MGDGLRIGGHLVMFFVRQVNITRLERSQDIFDEGESIVGSTMLDQDLKRVENALPFTSREETYQRLVFR